MFKKFAGFALIALFAASTVTAAEEAQKPEAQVDTDTIQLVEEQPSEISEQQFQLEQQIMVRDLAGKLTVIKTAHDCAEKAENIEALRQCADEFRDAILNQAAKR